MPDYSNQSSTSSSSARNFLKSFTILGSFVVLTGLFVVVSILNQKNVSPTGISAGANCQYGCNACPSNAPNGPDEWCGCVNNQGQGYTNVGCKSGTGGGTSPKYTKSCGGGNIPDGSYSWDTNSNKCYICNGNESGSGSFGVTGSSTLAECIGNSNSSGQNQVTNGLTGTVTQVVTIVPSKPSNGGTNVTTRIQADFCDSKENGAYCNGNYSIACANHKIAYSFNCTGDKVYGGKGGSCNTKTGTCLPGKSDAADPEYCKGKPNGNSCQGDISINCDGLGNISYSRICGTKAGTCDLESGNCKARVLQDSEEKQICNALNLKPFCSGNFLATCTNDKKVHELLDCSFAYGGTGGTCDEVAGNCIAGNTPTTISKEVPESCTPSNYPNTCLDPKTRKYCDAGTVKSYDCTTVGADSCSGGSCVKITNVTAPSCIIENNTCTAGGTACCTGLSCNAGKCTTTPPTGGGGGGGTGGGGGSSANCPANLIMRVSTPPGSTLADAKDVSACSAFDVLPANVVNGEPSLNSNYKVKVYLPDGTFRVVEGNLGGSNGSKIVFNRTTDVTRQEMLTQNGTYVFRAVSADGTTECAMARVNLTGCSGASTAPMVQDKDGWLVDSVGSCQNLTDNSGNVVTNSQGMCSKKVVQNGSTIQRINQNVKCDNSACPAKAGDGATCTNIKPYYVTGANDGHGATLGDYYCQDRQTASSYDHPQNIGYKCDGTTRCSSPIVTPPPVTSSITVCATAGGTGCTPNYVGGEGLQKAMDDIANGGTINVGSGTYKVPTGSSGFQFKTAKQNVKILGPEILPNQMPTPFPVIDGNNEPYAFNFSIQDTKNITLMHLNIVNTGSRLDKVGIYLGNNVEAVIDTNNISGLDVGVTVIGTSKAEIKNNQIKDNKAGSLKIGVSCASATAVINPATSINNVISGNGTDYSAVTGGCPGVSLASLTAGSTPIPACTSLTVNDQYGSGTSPVLINIGASAVFKLNFTNINTQTGVVNFYSYSNGTVGDLIKSGTATTVNGSTTYTYDQLKTILGDSNLDKVIQVNGTLNPFVDYSQNCVVWVKLAKPATLSSTMNLVIPNVANTKDNRYTLNPGGSVSFELTKTTAFTVAPALSISNNDNEYNPGNPKAVKYNNSDVVHTMSRVSDTKYVRTLKYEEVCVPDQNWNNQKVVNVQVNGLEGSTNDANAVRWLKCTYPTNLVNGSCPATKVVGNCGTDVAMTCASGTPNVATQKVSGDYKCLGSNGGTDSVSCSYVCTNRILPACTRTCEKDADCGTGKTCQEVQDSTCNPGLNGAKQACVATPAVNCIKTGCNGEICSDHSVDTTCQYKDVYACYKAAECKVQTNGQCGFTQTDTLKSCIASYSVTKCNKYDLNSDGKVDIFNDFTIFLNNFINNNLNSDFNNDKVVDIKDFLLFKSALYKYIDTKSCNL